VPWKFGWIWIIGLLVVGSAPPAIADSGRLVEFPVPTPASRPYQITAGPDGNLWFTESDAGAIGRITPDGVITEFRIRKASGPYGITVGPDGNIWFAERYANLIAKFDPVAEELLAEYTVPTANSQPWDIAPGPDGNLWFTEEDVDQIGRITTDGDIEEFPSGTCCFPTEITAGADGNLWFTEELGSAVVRMTTSGDVTVFTAPTAQLLYGIALGPDGNVWFTALAGDRKVGKVTPSGRIREFAVPAQFTGIAGITAGPDGNLWLSENDAGMIIGMTPSGRKVGRIADGSYPIGITAGPDGNIWIAESQSNAIGRLRIDPVRSG